VTDRTRDRVARALDALVDLGWTVVRDRSGLLEIDEDAYPMLAVDQRSLDEPFDDEGELTDDLDFVRHGPAADIQVAFERERLCVALSPDDEEEDFALEPRRVATETDLMMLFDALEALRSRGFAVGAGIGDTPSDAWAWIDDQAGGQATDALLWTREAHRAAFDRVGNLEGPLHLGWRGDRAAIAAAFTDTVFEVEEPVDDDDTFVISS
jgi:hypothetical protein